MHIKEGMIICTFSVGNRDFLLWRQIYEGSGRLNEGMQALGDWQGKQIPIFRWKWSENPENVWETTNDAWVKSIFMAIGS